MKNYQTVIYVILLLMSLSDLIDSKKKSHMKNFSKSYLTTPKLSLTTQYYEQFFSECECNDETCNQKNGKCVDPNKCVCDIGYSNYKLKSYHKTCSYKLKNQIIAFLLEFFLWFGIGHFYCMRYLMGIIKLCTVLLIIIFDCTMKNIKFKSNKARNCINIFIYCLYFILILWQIFDVCMFGMNKYKDGNGVPLLNSY